MEGSGAAGVEGRGKQVSVGEWRGWALLVRAASACASIAKRPGASAAALNGVHTP